jgi:hypothetical protein
MSVSEAFQPAESAPTRFREAQAQFAASGGNGPARCSGVVLQGPSAATLPVTPGRSRDGRSLRYSRRTVPHQARVRELAPVDVRQWTLVGHAEGLSARRSSRVVGHDSRRR